MFAELTGFNLAIKACIASAVALIALHFTPLGSADPGRAPLLPGKENLVVVFITETSEENKMPVSQYNALHDAEIDAYMKSACVKDTSGTPEFKYWDKDVPLAAGIPQNLQDAFNKAKADPKFVVPWLVAANVQSKTAYSGQLPLDKASILAKLQQYGGK